MKGIILAGGKGTRLYPLTKVTSKQLMPVYDKPMIYYPLSTLMLAGITEILIISTPDDLHQYKALLCNGSEVGVKFLYKAQPSPDGLAQAFILGEKFIGQEDVCLILGDNIFYGDQLPSKLKESVLEVKNNKNAVIFAYPVLDPKRYGVVNFDIKGAALSIEEKPEQPKSNYAVSGIYFYPNEVLEVAKHQKKSKRNELEITDTNMHFLKNNKLHVTLMGRGYAWLDTGTHDSLIEASQFVQTLEKRQGMKISCIEEIAFRLGYISKGQILKFGQKISETDYGKYLINLATSN